MKQVRYKDVKDNLPSLELMKLYSEGMRSFPGSKKHKEILAKINKLTNNHI